MIDKFIQDFKPNENQIKQLDDYANLIKEYNKVMNLTGIDEYEEVYLKHFYDSMTINGILKNIEFESLGDLGTGAGLPGVVLAIFYPDKKIYLIEPLTKRCKFLEVVKEKLQLNNVIILNKRAEEIDLKFDVIVSRAVAKLNILLELSIPLINTGGYFIPLKGAAGTEEIKNAKNALLKLNAEIKKIDEIILPFEESKRVNILIQKNRETNNKYPRNYGQIKKAPL